MSEPDSFDFRDVVDFVVCGQRINPTEVKNLPRHLNLKNLLFRYISYFVSDRNPRSRCAMEYKNSDITNEVIGCAMRVHSALGNGFQEIIYQRALEIEMKSLQLNFKREHEMLIHYAGRAIGTRHNEKASGNIPEAFVGPAGHDPATP